MNKLIILVAILYIFIPNTIKESYVSNICVKEYSNYIDSSYFPKLKHQKIIDCLIKYESSGNENAVGDSGLAKGILQFHTPTFIGYCIEKYGLKDDIWDQNVQIVCANKMIEENWSNIRHWSVYKKCI